MPDVTPGIAQQMRLWQSVQKLQQELVKIQMEMIRNSDYLRKGAHTRLNKYIKMYDEAARDFQREVEDYDRTAAINLYFDGVASVGSKGKFNIPTEDRLALQEIANLSSASHHQELAMMRSDLRRFGNDIRKEPKNFRGEIRGVPTWNQNAGRYLTPVKIDWRPDLEKWMRDHRVRGIRYRDGRKMDLNRHESMAIKTVRGRAYNLGRIAAIEQSGERFVEVFDGPGCGWTSHHDPDIANGKVVTIEEARANPIAHPSCQRQFHPTKKTPPEKDKGSKTKTALKAAAAVGAVVAAAEASNLAVRAVQAAARSETLGRMQDELLRKGMETRDPRAFALEHRIDLFRQSWTQKESRDTDAMIFHLYNERQHGFSEVLNKQLLATGTEGVPFSMASFRPELMATGAQGSVAKMANAATEFADTLPRAARLAASVPQRIDDLTHDVFLLSEAWAKGYLEYHHIPSKVRHVLGATEGQLADRFSLFARMLKNQRIREMGAQEFRNLISYEQRVKKYQQIEMFSGTPAQSAAKFNWSKWGPRVRVDITEWLRTKSTMTPTGMIKSLTVAPRRAVRGTIRMFQDGNIGGSLSLVPKGIFRALVEVDDLGRVTGNVRLVPGGPIRVKFEFATPRPENWKQLGLIPGSDFVDWRARQEAARLAEGSFVDKLRAFDVANAAKELHQMELKRVVVDLRVLNTDVVKLSTQLRIPLQDVREAVREGFHLGQLQREAGGGFSGLLTIPFERGLDEFRQAWSLGEVKSTVFADVSFQKPVFHGEIKNRVHLSSGLIQDVATNMRFRGYTLIDIANVLEVRVDTVRSMVENGMARSRMFLRELGVNSLLEVEPAWASRVQVVMEAVPFRDKGMNRADVLSKTVDAFYADRLSQGQNFSIRTLAGITAEDSGPTIELKLRSLVDFMKQSEVGSDELMGKLDGTSKVHIHSLARKLEAENKRVTGASQRRLRSLSAAEGSKFIIPPGRDIKLLRKEGELTPTLTADEERFISHLKYAEKNHGVSDWALEIVDDPYDGTEGTFLAIIEDANDSRPLVVRVNTEAFKDLTEAQQALFSTRIEDMDPEAVNAALQQLDFMRQRFPGTVMPDVMVDFLRGYRDFTGLTYETNDRVIGMWMGPNLQDTPIWGKGAWRRSVHIHDEFQAEGNVTGFSYGRSTIIHETSHYLHHGMERTVEGSRMLADALLPLGIDADLDITHAGPVLDMMSDPKHVRALVDELGWYATTNYWELIAEAERHYLTDPHPGPIATAVGEAMDEFYNWRTGVNVRG